MLFAKFRNSLIGDGAAIVLPGVGSKVDYEAELAVVIGKRGSDVAEADALAARRRRDGVQRRQRPRRPAGDTAVDGGKAIDTFAPCGPALVTLDELGDLQDLAIRARASTARSSRTAARSKMIFGVAETIAFLSQS